MLFSKDEIKRIDAVKERITIGQDIFGEVIEAWKDNLQSFQFTTDDKQYFEYLNIKPTDTIIDAGLCKGYEALQFYKIVKKHGRVYAFDPFGSKYAIPSLKKIIYLNKMFNVKNLQIIKGALWNNNKSVHFKQTSWLGSSYCVEPTPQCDGNITGIKLDSYIQDNNIKQVDIIKMDIEGSELKALEGAMNIIQSFKPQIAVGIYHSKTHLYKIPELLLQYNNNYELIFNQYSNEVGRPTGGPIESVMYFL
jgi:FkbM family methyltransferase